VRQPPYFQTLAPSPKPVVDIDGARVLALLGDSVTTDHISPAGAIKRDGPAGLYLQEHGVDPKDFNSYGARRGNHEVMMRGTFANIRLRNQLGGGRGPLPEGGLTRKLPSGEQMSIYDAAMAYIDEGVPLVVVAGKEYGSGSSRDWAAKGTRLLGVRAVLAQSYERIHRANLVGMGVLPLQLPDSPKALGITGEEVFSIAGFAEPLNAGELPSTVTVRAGRDRVLGAGADRYAEGGGSTSATAGSCATSCASCATRRSGRRGAKGGAPGAQRVGRAGLPAARAAAVDDGLDALGAEAARARGQLDRGAVELGVEVLDRPADRADEVMVRRRAGVETASCPRAGRGAPCRDPRAGRASRRSSATRRSEAARRPFRAARQRLHADRARAARG